MTNYVRCCHNCGNDFFRLFPNVKQPLFALKLLKVQIMQHDLGRKMLSNHLLFAVVLSGRLPSSLWWSVQRCWLCGVELPTEKEVKGCHPFIACDHFIELLFDLLLLWKGLRMQTFCNLFSMSCLFFVVRHNKKSVLTWETESFGKKRYWAPKMLSCELWQNLRRRQGLGEPVRHIGCLKTSKSSSFTLKFSQFTWHLGFFLKAVSSFHVSAYFLHFTAIMAWPLCSSVKKQAIKAHLGSSRSCPWSPFLYITTVLQRKI